MARVAYGRRVRQLSELPGAELQEQVQKNKSRRTASSKEVGPVTQAPPAPADHLSHDRAEGDYFASYFEAGLSDIACEEDRV